MRKIPPINIEEAGNLARAVTNDLIMGIKQLVPIKGRVYIEINLEIKDENVIQDDHSRSSKIVIELDLEAPKPKVELDDGPISGENFRVQGGVDSTAQ